MKEVYNDRNQRREPTFQRISPAPFVPTIVKKKQEDHDDKSSSDADPRCR